MEEEMRRVKRQNLVFTVNGERFELPSVAPSTTLLEFLRTKTCFKSVKLGCGEGGCGACVVLLSKYDPVHDKIENFTISSCLTLLCSVHGCSITTNEGLGNSRDGFHPIHKRFAGFHASQCGFCTPGMCMSLYGALVNAEKENRPEPPEGFSKMTVAEAEKAIAGNLCRCTGYRPIADACKSFAANVDIEDLGFNSFWKKEDSEMEKIIKLPPYDPHHEIFPLPGFWRQGNRSSILLDSEKYSWHHPGSVEELLNLLNVVDAKLVAGNTGSGYYKELNFPEKYIDIRYVPSLSIIRKDDTGIEIGATVTIAKAIEVLEGVNGVQFQSDNDMILKKIAAHMEKVANKFVRNTASIGGNLVLAQAKQFPSDVATILLGAGSFVDIITGAVPEMITLEEFLERPPLDHKSVLLKVKIPNWETVKEISSARDSKFLFETYRAAPRPHGNALAYLNAAFLAEVSQSKVSGEILLKRCHLAFGAFGTKHAIRARKAEEVLTGNLLTLDVLHEAIKLVKEIVVPEVGTLHSAYRTSLAVSFLFDFLGPLILSRYKPYDGWLDGYGGFAVYSDARLKLEHGRPDLVHSPTILSSSKQVIPITRIHDPVGLPIPKTGAALQASGEAVYVDDIPCPKNCLYGAFVYSTKPLARVDGMEIDLHSLSAGAKTLISFRDIPERGENIGSKSIFGIESLFADDLTRYAGERLAVVVADTQRHANVAAIRVKVNYDMENLEPPILTVEEAVRRSSFFSVPPTMYPKQVGDIAKGMAEADQKILAAKMKLESEYYFYMESQTALAVPDEDNCMVVYSSSQCPEYAHSVIARCIGVPEHNVRVITRRLGGGFGGKAMRSIPIATACALAAHVLRRPVRMYVDRQTDMIITGGRHPMEITYSVGFKNNGKITALELDILINAGISPDVSPMLPNNIMRTLRKYDWGALSFIMKVCKTNLSSKSAMRGPGEVQGSYIAEKIIEHVASALFIDVDYVRNINLHTYDSLKLFYSTSYGEPHEYTLRSIWNHVGVSSEYEQRAERIRDFNRHSIWIKRGISRIPTIHEVDLLPFPGKVGILSDGSVVCEVGGVDMGQGLWTKVKQMVAYSLSFIDVTGADKLLEKVRLVQSDTLSVIQGGVTAGSTSSEVCCEAAEICCKILVQRLTPLKESLMQENGSITWETLIAQAYSQFINLQASTLHAPIFKDNRYLNYGAAVSEVEINLLTGATTILRSDVIYDCGQSLNPAVDLGQVEGAFVQGVGLFMLEEYLTNSDGLMVSKGTWDYKIPSLDTIPKQFNVEIFNSGHHKKRVLSSKASGEPPLILAASVHCATRAAIREARQQLRSWGYQYEFRPIFELEVPAIMPVVKELCGLDIVERYLEWKKRSK